MLGPYDSEADVVPRDEQAEVAVIGAAMLSRPAAAEAVEAITASDFYAPKHEAIFEAIAALVSRAEPTDAIAVTDELRRRGELDRVGGAMQLHEMASMVPSAVSVGYYAEIVRERAVLRRLLEAGRSIAIAAGEGGEADEVVERARGLVDSVSSRTVRSTHWIGDSLPSLLAELQSGGASFERTGWSGLDGFIGGLRPGALYIIGARPGAGKTAVALNIAAAVAGRGISAGYASLEMGEAELQRRLLASEGSIHLSGLLDGNLSAQDWQKIETVRSRVDAMRISVLDDAASLARVLSFARTLHRKGRLGLLVVDYLQLMHGDGRAESRQVEVSEFSRALKLLAKELKIPVVALSQLNRESTGRKGGEPKISDLRESGSLEQDADVVLLLHRDEERSASQLKVIVAKNRHGRVGEVSLQWEGRFARAVEMPWDPMAILNERGQ